MIRNLQEGPNTVEVQETTFSLDVLGRYVCNTYDEAVNNGGFPFDAIVIGAGMYGAYIAEKIYRKGQGNLRVLVLDAGSFLVSEHVQNLSRIGLNVPGPTTIDPASHESVSGDCLGVATWYSQGLLTASAGARCIGEAGLPG